MIYVPKGLRREDKRQTNLCRGKEGNIINILDVRLQQVSPPKKSSQKPLQMVNFIHNHHLSVRLKHRYTIKSVTKLVVLMRYRRSYGKKGGAYLTTLLYKLVGGWW